MKRFAFVFFIIVSACRAEWQRVAPGVEYRRITRDTLDAHVARIDLRNANIRVIASSASDRGLTVSEFAKKNRALVAINADYFDEQLRPIGLAMGACGVWAEGIDVGRKQGLVGVGRRKAEIQSNTMKPRPWMTGAVSGWPLLNTNCHPVEKLPGSDHFTRAPHPRTAVGLSKNGRTMYFVVTDGRREGVPGLTLPELAQLMDELGACVAMNLDGGGSSAMWVEDEIVNRPSDGTERKVVDHLAVVAASDYSGCTESEKR
ncbi:MAG TPA: phosphodiester glycosidase family protein [Thermoanaerobaculia bacterium]|nr:phosphodiester glycosidase family protein [Thermoanaerobaculia bacterium]